MNDFLSRVEAILSGVMNFNPKSRVEKLLMKWVGSVGNIEDLETYDKSSVVAAINEIAESGGGEVKPYTSLKRLGSYIYEVTFDKLPTFAGGDVPVNGACSSYVQGGKLYRNLDWAYSELASFHVICKGFEGIAFSPDLADGYLSNSAIGQLPYRLVDGCNDYGIRVSTHVLFNDWDWVGSGDTPLYKIPYTILSSVKSLDNLGEQLEDVLADLYATESLVGSDYLLQFVVTDGISTYAILPPESSSGSYVVQDISENPKLTNFRWVSDETVVRADLQDRPTGVERWNLMPCDLKDLRFTKAYESTDRLSEFIGIDGTTKDSTDEELTDIYNEAHNIYLARERDGQTWQTMHSVVYNSNGMESLWVQEDWGKNYIYTLKSDLGELADLDTEAKNNLVAAINEVKQSVSPTVTVEPEYDDVAKFYLWGNTLPTSKNDGAVDFQYRYISQTKDTSGYCTVKVQGDWSTTYPKKNFNINLFKDAEHANKDKKNFRGWGKTNKFTLKANYIDHTHARNIVNAWLWKEIVESRSNFDTLPEALKTSPHMGCVDGFPVKVYQNGNYYGIFTMNIRKGEFMFGMDDENPLHFAVKGDNNDNGRIEDRAYNFRALWDGYDTSGNWQVEAGELDEDTGKAGDSIKDALNALIACVKDTDDATFKASIGTYLDMQSAIDYMLFIWAFCGIDSAENNFMLLNYDGVKWITNGYDMDASWGIYGDGSTTKVSTTTAFPSQYMGNRSLLWERILENYVPEIKARWAELRESILTYPNITNKLERMWYWIGEDLLAEDITVWPNVPSKTVNNIAFTRNYVRDRLAYVDGAIEALEPPVEPIPCTALSLDKNSISIDGVNTETITATPTPADTTDVVTWASSNTSVATVSNGVVTSVANGTATITATCGTQTATCSVTVTGISHAIPCTGISLSASELAFTTEDAQTLVATPTPSDTTDVVVWSTSDVNTATVSNGVVTPIANGSCTITATCGSYHADCAVTVSAFESDYPLETAVINRGYKMNDDGTLNGNGTESYYCVSEPIQLPKGAYNYRCYGNNKVIDDVYTNYLKMAVYDSSDNFLGIVAKDKYFWVGDDFADFKFAFQLEGSGIMNFTQQEIAQLLVKVDNSETAVDGQTAALKDWTWTEGGAKAVWAKITDHITGLTDQTAVATEISSMNITTFNKKPNANLLASSAHFCYFGTYQGFLIYYNGVGNVPATAVQYFTDNDVVLEINGGAA